MAGATQTKQSSPKNQLISAFTVFDTVSTDRHPANSAEKVDLPYQRETSLQFTVFT